MMRSLGAKTWPQGWRFGIWLNVVCATTVLVINLSIMIWALSTGATTDGDDRRSLYEGDCAQVKAINTAGHVVINTLSTILLSASNYSMQCLVAPNRKEVDVAHKKQTWLNVGTHSLRNLKQTAMPPLRRWLWFLLAISSLPLHLVYNSALFSALSAIEYNVLRETSDFLSPDRKNSTSESIADDLHEMALSGHLERLENLECISEYAQDFQGSRSNLVLIVEKDAQYSSTKIATYKFSSGEGTWQAFDSWLCLDIRKKNKDLSGFCTAYLPELKASPSEWTVDGVRVEYCLSQPAPRNICKLYFSPAIAGVVVGMNAIKAIAIALVLYAVKDTPLLTLGDAVSSFLDFPDETTSNMGVVSKNDLKSKNGYTTWITGPKSYDSSRKPRWHATGLGRVGWFIASYVILMLLFAAGFFMGLTRLEGGSRGKIWEYGIGTVRAQTLITGAPDLPLIAAIIVANTPQLFLSGIYFWYNSILTSMAMAMEWDQFGFLRKGIRVSSSPRGSQRSSRLLQLPYRLAIPLMVTSGVLHWLASQSLFLANVDYIRSDPPIPKESRLVTYESSRPFGELYFSTCGYSLLAILFLIFIGLLMIVVLAIISLTRFKTGIPVAGSCSAALSAACHGYAKGGPEASERPVQWGEVLVEGADGTVKRRCAFSHEEVSEPIDGRIYPTEVGGSRRGSLVSSSEDNANMTCTSS